MATAIKFVNGLPQILDGCPLTITPSARGVGGKLLHDHPDLVTGKPGALRVEEGTWDVYQETLIAFLARHSCGFSYRNGTLTVSPLTLRFY